MTFTIHEQRFLDGVARAARGVLGDISEVSARNTPFKGVEIREAPDGSGGSRLLFTGYASITEQPYEMEDWLGTYSEVVRSGAFGKTLAEGADVAFLLNHCGSTMARTKPGTLRLSEDDTGLYVEADLDPSRSDVQIVRSGIDGGELDEMSFAFRVLRQMWSPDYDERSILEVSLDKGDVSVVNYGANPFTGGTVSLRSKRARQVPSMLSLVMKRELRADQNLSQSTVDTLTQILSLVSDADECVDEVQVVLSDLLGVANPDDEQDAEMEQESAPAASEQRENEVSAETAEEAESVFTRGAKLRALEALLLED